MAMGQIVYFDRKFSWKTHKTAFGEFEAKVLVDAKVIVLGLYRDRKAAWRAAKAEANRQLDIWRQIVIAQAKVRRDAKRFKKSIVQTLTPFVHRQRMTTAEILAKRLEV